MEFAYQRYFDVALVAQIRYLTKIGRNCVQSTV